MSLLCSACAFTGIDLVQDKRIALSSPRDGATVTLPLTLRWDIRSRIGTSGDAVQYAVFVDRTVIKPGQTMRSIVPSTDTDCIDDPACPDTEYLNRHGVYLVDEPSAVISRLPKQKAQGGRETHRLTVVILVDGRRQGEGAFSRIVYLKEQS